MRFIIRALVQLILLTPKPAILPDPPPNRPYIGAILGTNMLCIILHALLSAPSAGEATRGYLHGGLAMDFIGQKGPTSKLHLLLLDLAVLLLQLVHLSAHVTRQRLKGEGGITVTTTTGQQYTPAAANPPQDIEHEERGVRRSDEQQDIEMQTLNPSGSTIDPVAPEETAEASTSRDSLNNLSRTDAHIFDAFNSGQIILADLDIARTTSEQFWAYQSTPRDSDPVATGRRFGANLTAQMLRWRFGGAAERTVRTV